MKCVIFCEEFVTHVSEDTCQLSLYKMNAKDLQMFFRIGESILWLLNSILIPDRLNCKFVGANFNATQNVQ